MNQTQTTVPVVIPPALDVTETELAARNEFLADKNLLKTNNFDDTRDAELGVDEFILDENDVAPGGAGEASEAKEARRAKRRKSLIFLLVFGVGFGIFVIFISWAFGFGFFAPLKRISVDRNQNTNGANSSPIASSDEKLKTALAMVANDTQSNQAAPVISDNSTNPNSVSEQDLKLASDANKSEQANKSSSGNMIVLPNENEHTGSNRPNNQIPISEPQSPKTVNPSTPNLLAGETSNPKTNVPPPTNNKSMANLSGKTDDAVARSVFFGSVSDKKDSVSQKSSTLNGKVLGQNSVSIIESAKTQSVPPFGTLLPIRFLGAIYTLERGTGGLVRMELVRAVQKGGFSYPAGTVIAGKLSGSEYNRAFISIIGAIDPKSGKLVKFEGDVVGVDGASGVVGTRKSIKSWGTRFMGAIREAGGQAINVLAARGGRGGTIVVGGTTSLGDEVSNMIRGNSQSDSFVMVRAGTDAYVLVTDLPGEQKSNDVLTDQKLASPARQIPGINLNEAEMAEILTTDDADKIRAALMKMSPQFRALAIKAIEEGK